MKTARKYRLSARGRRSLQATIRRNQPWLWSTGPRSEVGKNRSRMNVFRHGARSADARRDERAAVELIELVSRLIASCVCDDAANPSSAETLGAPPRPKARQARSAGAALGGAAGRVGHVYIIAASSAARSRASVQIERSAVRLLGGPS